MKLFTLICILALFFIPIPIKFSVVFLKNKLTVKLYKYSIFPRKASKSIKRKHKAKKNLSKKEKFDPSKENSKNNKKVNSKLIDVIKPLYFDISRNKFKPTFKFDLSSNYSLNDAANTAIFFGASSNLNYVLHKLFSIFFKIKKFNLNISPVFSNDFMLNIDFTSIIYISLAQIIYIIWLVLKNIFLKRR